MADRVEDYDPSKGNWTQIWNLVLRKLISYKLDSNEWSILMLVISKTWMIHDKKIGTGKAWAVLKWDDIKEETELGDSSSSYARAKLKARNILHTKITKKGTSYKINSKVSTWIPIEDIPEEVYRKRKSLHPGEVEKMVIPLHPGGVPHSTQVKSQLHPGEVPPIKESIKEINTPPKPPKKKPKKPASRKKPEQAPEKERACSLPAFFQLSLEMERYALNKGIDVKKVDDFFESFLNWASAKGIECVDWEAQFKTHVDNAPQYGKQYMLKTPKRK
jgi:hypothetical protein